jgi:amino acid transporter
MIGGGIFAILGLVSKVAGSALPVVFLVGAVVAFLSVYSYTKLGLRYPSVGGACQFLVQGFGDGLLAGGLNIFQYFAYVISLALYAGGFAGYAVALLHSPPAWATKAFAVGVVLLFVAVNFIGAAFMGKAETLIVVVKVSILVFFGLAGLFHLDSSRLSPSGWKGPVDILTAVTLVFMGYQGFGLITNAAGDMKNPKRELPRAMYTAFALVIAIYVLIAVTLIGTTPMDTITHSSTDLLSVAARGFLGQFGFYLLAVCALLSTSSAVNAVLFGTSNIAYMVAKDGELPTSAFAKQLWGKNVEGLLVTAGLVILLILFLDLEPISMMASGAFLFVYASVNAAHLRIADKTGAKKWILEAGVVVTLGMFALLMVYMVKHAPPAAWITFLVLLFGSFLFEWIYRHAKGRSMGTMVHA